ncbi:hypothetical protein WMF45_10835 [Sorangium sp. So ce448]|uniref:hypothetical protein n=1 Tax=Sorangium sp. So ce448 TaxID=3133314 RepID=UPI003F627C17
MDRDSSLDGPWSEPKKIDVFPHTPPGSDMSYERGTGFDNWVFVVPGSCKTSMLIKNGLCNGTSTIPMISAST